MIDNLRRKYQILKAQGLSREQDQKIRLEIDQAEKQYAERLAAQEDHLFPPRSLYEYNDIDSWSAGPAMLAAFASNRSLDDLMARDKKREEDGFPRKIRLGRVVKPGGKHDDRVVVVPTTVEEKFLHDTAEITEEDGGEGEGEDPGYGGHGDGEEGEVIGEQPIRDSQEGQGGAGQGAGGSHEIESNAYDLGRVLTEEFKLPNLKDKGKKRSLTKYSYDLTDRHRGFGQVLDKKATLRRIIKTNIGLGRISQGDTIETDSLLISPNDRIYRILSKEKDYESQAVVFFIRDYSGSMSGRPTEMVVSQHVLIYSWLIYQYESQVETRFVLHDTEAKEVENFNIYYNSKVAGGTQVASAYRLVNGIVEQENLQRNYNIYVFHGTDGDDWDTTGEEAISELKKMLAYAARIGITIAENNFGIPGRSDVERYVKKSGLLEEKSDLIRLDVLEQGSNESRLIEGIRALIS
jgi:uncharacterized sporulation protein YeaH/YhbH (DUF444 family)